MPSRFNSVYVKRDQQISRRSFTKDKGGCTPHRLGMDGKRGANANEEAIILSLHCLSLKFERICMLLRPPFIGC